MSPALHPAAPQHLPAFITAPGSSDILMIVAGVILILAILGVGNFYLHLHSLPERMAHKSKKLQFEIVAVLGLLSLFTHNHAFWIVGLLLAMIDLPDFITPLRSIASSVGRIAGVPPAEVSDGIPVETVAPSVTMVAATAEPSVAKTEPTSSKAGLAQTEAPRHA